MEHPGVAPGARADGVRAAGAAAGGTRPAAVTTGVFLQVRLGSRRLPRKALLPLGDSTVIRQAMRALRRVPAGVHALLTDAG